MKNHLLTKAVMALVLMLYTIGFVPAQTPVPNGNFEIWANKSLYEKPEFWYTQDDPNKAVVTTFKQGDAADGNYSIRLVTVFDDEGPDEDNVMDAYTALADLSQGLLAGYPWTTVVDQFHVSVKYDVVEGDAANVIAWLIKDGAILTATRYPLTGNSDGEWVPLSLPFFFPGTGEPIAPDQIMVAFVSSSVDDIYLTGETNPYTPAPGSWLMVDNVFFTLGSDPTPILVPNHSFESWVDVAVVDPTNWTSDNFHFTDTQAKPVTRDANAFAGDWAARLEVKDRLGAPQTSSLHLGPDIWENGGIPYTEKPQAVTMAYKYQPVNNDEASITIWFRGDPVPGYEYDGFGHIEQIPLAVTDYQKKGAVFFWPGDFQPEELEIQILPGNNTGSVLYVDEIQFEPTYQATFFVNDAEGNPVTGAQIFQEMFPYAFAVNTEGITTIPFYNGTFDYKVTASGYSDYENSFVMNGEDIAVNVTMQLPTHLKEMRPANKPLLYPNPFNEFIYMKEPESIARVTFQNTNGTELIKTETVTNPLNTSILPPGIYIVTIEFLDGKISNQMMVKK